MTRSTQQKHGCHMETLLNNLKLGLATAATDCGEGEADCDGRIATAGFFMVTITLTRETRRPKWWFWSFDTEMGAFS